MLNSGEAVGSDALFKVDALGGSCADALAIDVVVFAANYGSVSLVGLLHTLDARLCILIEVDNV